MTPRLKDRYKKEIIQSLMIKLNYKNINAVPKIKKIVLNMGLGQDGLDKKKMEVCIKDMSSITGQYPVITKFKKSISNFKSRKGSNAGLKVTLRNDRMYEFIDRLVYIGIKKGNKILITKNLFRKNKRIAIQNNTVNKCIDLLLKII